MNSNTKCKYGEKTLIKLNLLADAFKYVVSSSHHAFEGIISFSSKDKEKVLKEVSRINKLDNSEMIKYAHDTLNKHKWNATFIISPNMITDHNVSLSVIMIHRGYYEKDLECLNYVVSKLTADIDINEMITEIRGILFINRILPLLTNATKENINDITDNRILDIVNRSYILDILIKSVSKVQFDLESALNDPNTPYNIKCILNKIKNNHGATEEEFNTLMKYINLSTSMQSKELDNDDIILN